MVYEFNLGTADAKKAWQDILGSEAEKLPVLCEGKYEIVVTDKQGTMSDYAEVKMTPVIMNFDTKGAPTFPLYKLNAQTILANLKATFPALGALGWAVQTTTAIYPVAVVWLMFEFSQCNNSKFGMSIEFKKA